MLADINKDTVDFVPNFDETEKEPTVLPSKYPNLMVNGASGIAVGMATNIPPHNLREVVAAVDKIIDNRVLEDRDTDIEELMEIIKGPDFPTGATILGRRGIEEAYRTGKGKIRVRAVTEINSLPKENLIQKSTNQENLSYTELDNKIDDTDENNIEEICPNCKNPIKKGIKFCGNCGQKLL